MAVHSAGYTHFDEAYAQGTISTPRTLTSDPVCGLLIPKSVVQELRMHLKNVYPDLAEKPFIGTRLCWYEKNPFFFGTHEVRESHDDCLSAKRYNDSLDGDWVIGHFPNDESLIIATAGSGHAYKVIFYFEIQGRCCWGQIIEPDFL